MNDLLLWVRVVMRTSEMKIWRRRLADYVKKLHQKACRACTTIIFPRSTNQSIDLWHCCRHRHLLKGSLRFDDGNVNDNATNE